ncbi:hypothetical protein L1987_35453 [Smallanthus sonchifolius]|uniref:Uncharacterized protein n=1 Tax=Smallanthus sonchifolius TaxID=185202 RepID=A0ACB9HXF7_9ASTR|nr:hypothetical protein L1987_35453 [Smallanthus sonchifolius]
MNTWLYSVMLRLNSTGYYIVTPCYSIAYSTTGMRGRSDPAPPEPCADVVHLIHPFYFYLEYKFTAT